MQKYVEILEQKVQWIAIGLGGLFCLYMIWAYVIHPPASVAVGSDNLGASEIDPYTVEHMAAPLDAAIHNRGQIDVKVPEYVDSFKQTMAWEKNTPIALASENWMGSTAKDIPLPNTPQQPGTTPGANPGNPGAVAAGGPIQKVTHLPNLPPASPSDTKFGRSVVLVPPPSQPGQPVQQVQMPQQIVPGQPVPGSQDMDWVTALFKLNLDSLADAYRQANLPPQLQKAEFLQVVLEREELDENGAPVPGTLTTIQPLGTWRQQTPPPYPGGGLQDRMAQAQYLQWAASNTADILEPVFYQTIPGKGDQWTKPGQQVQAQNLVFDPSKYTGPWSVPPLTTEQYNAVRDYRQQQYKAREQQKHQVRPNRNNNTGPGMEPGDVVGDPTNYAPARVDYAPAPARPAAHPPARPAAPAAPAALPAAYRPPYAANAADPTGEPGDMPDIGMGGPTPVAQGLPVPGTDYPTGEYNINDPKWKGKIIEIWANDNTVQSGKTYHYRIRYKMKNPIFLQRNIVNDPALANRFDIVSPPSDWSSPVQIPPLVNFFVANSKSPNRNTVGFQIFRWDQGQQKTETFQVGPGDEVGGQSGGVNYSTGWTVVDFRNDPRQQGDTQILLENKDGKIIARSYRGDANDPLYLSLKQQIAQANAAAAAANGQQTPGGPLAGGAPQYAPR